MGVFDAFSTQPAQNAANAVTSGYQSGLQQLGPQYAAGRNALQQNYTAGLQPFQQNYKAASAGQDAYGAALGLGPGGSQGIQQQLQNTPGYQFTLNQGTDNTKRQMASLGLLASGNTIKGIDDYTTGLANNTYQQYVQNLQPYLGASNAAAQGQGGLYSGLGNQLNQNYQGVGNAGYGAAVGSANAQANADLSAYNASNNMLNFGQNMAKTLMAFA